MSNQEKAPHIIIFVESGVVQGCYANMDIEVSVVDKDNLKVDHDPDVRAEAEALEGLSESENFKPVYQL